MPYCENCVFLQRRFNRSPRVAVGFADKSTIGVEGGRQDILKDVELNVLSAA